MKRRCGVSLLELVIATAIMATVATAAVALLRTSISVWEGHDGDIARLQSAHATVRHFVRHLRQCTAVSAITVAADTTGALNATHSNGDSVSWSLTSDEVSHAVNSSSALLADEITAMSFAGYEADGVTATTTVADIRVVKIDVTVQLDRAAGGTQSVSSRAWLRAW